MKQRKTQNISAFTLAEVLITLMVIGVLAVVTIPSLIQSWEERSTVTRLKKTYSELQQAYKLAEIENGAINTWGLNNQNVMDKMLVYLKILKSCKDKINQNCVSNDYKNMAGTTSGLWGGNGAYDSTYAVYKTILTNEVSLMAITSGYDYSCNLLYPSADSPDKVGACFSLLVDINALKPPNKIGIDTFVFYVTENGIVTVGKQYVPSKSKYYHDLNCKNSSSNGWGCSSWVIERGNMDYLHKDTTW